MVWFPGGLPVSYDHCSLPEECRDTHIWKYFDSGVGKTDVKSISSHPDVHWSGAFELCVSTAFCFLEGQAEELLATSHAQL